MRWSRRLRTGSTVSNCLARNNFLTLLPIPLWTLPTQAVSLRCLPRPICSFFFVLRPHRYQIMPGFNVSVQQYAPLIRYAPSSAWGPGSPADGKFSSYNDGFRLTTANGSTATFNFNGTGVWYALSI